MDTLRACLAVALLLAACQRIDVGQVGKGDPPARERGREEREESDDEDSPEHRPGQRCFDCHSEESHRDGPTFVLAGTIYERASAVDGAEGATVHIVDAAMHEYTTRPTYRGGNFMVSADELPWPLVFPLTVDVTLADGTMRAMRSRIGREGSCAGCHALGGADETHVERIWVIEEP